MKTRARIFETEERYYEERRLLRKTIKGIFFEDYKIDENTPRLPYFEDTGNEIPNWGGEIAAEYIYDENNELIDIIALW